MSRADRRLRAAVIGCGTIAYEHLPYLSPSPLVELAATVDRSKAAASFVAKRFNAAGFYTDHREMLAEAKPDVVHVLTPPHTHVAIVRDCLEAGAHVICEKPTAGTSTSPASITSVASSMFLVSQTRRSAASTAARRPR